MMAIRKNEVDGGRGKTKRWIEHLTITSCRSCREGKMAMLLGTSF